MKNILSIFILLGIFCAQTAAAALLRECGVYVMEGRLIKGSNGIPTFLVDQGSRSEMRVKLKPLDGNIGHYYDLKMRVKMRIFRACNYSCRGQIVKLEDLIAPYAQPKNFFFPPPKVLKREDCR